MAHPRQHHSDDDDRQQAGEHAPPSADADDAGQHRPRCSRSRTTTTRQRRPGRPKHAALLELFYGAALYTTCILLPSLPRHVCRASLHAATWLGAFRRRALWSVYISWRFALVVLERWGWLDDPYRTSAGGGEGGGGGPREDAVGEGLARRVSRYIFSTSTAALWEEFNQHHRNEAASDPQGGGDPAPFAWGFGRAAAASALPLPVPVLVVLQDLQVLLLLAVLLAVVRVWFVHMLVPEVLANPRRLEAMARCKSSHLLSSSAYQFGHDGAGAEPPRGTGGMGGRGGEGEEPLGRYERIRRWCLYQWYRLRPTVRRALGHEPSARYGDLVARDRPPARPPSPARRFSPPPASADPARHRLFSAPRHATATFRLLFTSVSCLAALSTFRSAEFWPRLALGTHPDAGTRHCWDLSGSFSALGFLDDDYDAKNKKLKYFFLTQAAYQLHSLCFHVVSMLLLLLYGGETNGGAEGSGGTGKRSWVGRLIGRFRNVGKSKDQRQHAQQPPPQSNKRLISMKTSMQSYFRPMMEHVIILAMLVGAYLFSGLRRLGAVGIFTLELSSVFLQLLQVSIYAPEHSRWRRPEFVRFVHRMLTVPTFVYCRLIVLPFVLWRSALFESQEWLDQIANVFSPGLAELLYTMFNGALCLIFALNLVLFRRLLYHPHLKQIVTQKGH